MDEHAEKQTFKQLKISPPKNQDSKVLQEPQQPAHTEPDPAKREPLRKRLPPKITHRRLGVTKFGQLSKKIKKVPSPTKRIPFPIDGKQQFGDKSICRLCHKTTDPKNQGTEAIEVNSSKKKKPKSQLNLYVVSCNRCHFKYHPDCVNDSEGKEPKAQPGTKWQCQKCNERVIKNQQDPPKKTKIIVKGQILLKGKKIKKKPAHLQMLQRGLPCFVRQTDDFRKKASEFASKYPQYVFEGQIVFPIHDEYLNAYQSIFGNNSNAKKIDQKVALKKPTPTEDTSIPQEAFADILFIWDAYNKYAEIIKDIIAKYEGENDAEIKTQMFNVGTFYHFKETETHLQNFSRGHIYSAIKEGLCSASLHALLLFFLSFYLKQIFEDIENETYNLKLANKGPYWQLMNYLWHCDREAYYHIIHDQLFQIPQMLMKYGFFTDLENKEILRNFDANNEVNLRKTLLLLSEGVIDLKRTQNLIQFRTEQILCSNRIKNQLSLDIKALRSTMAETQEQQKKYEADYTQAKKFQESTTLPRQETLKLQKIVDTSQKEIYKLKNQFNQDGKDFEKMKEQFRLLQEEGKIALMPQLLLNTSVFLGSDEKYSYYYFFIYESEKIFVSQNLTSLDDDDERRWGFYNSKAQIDLLLKSLQLKGVRENQLKKNVEELLKSELLSFGLKQNVQKDTESQVQIQSHKQIEKYDVPTINLQLIDVEKSFSDFLAGKDSRWTNKEKRECFRKNLEIDDIEVVAESVEYLIEHTMIQEKLEIKSEEEEIEVEEKQKKYDEKEQLKEKQKKRRVVEDDSSDLGKNGREQNEQGNLLEVYEKMRADRIKIRKLPLKLFGNHNENLKTQMLESIKEIKENGNGNNLLQVVISTLNRVVIDYISRKREKQSERQNNVKASCVQTNDCMVDIYEQEAEDMEQHSQQLQQEKQPFLEEILDETPRVSKNLRSRQKQRQSYVSEEENQWEEACKVCGSRGKVICCDTCPLVYHPKCLGLKQVPQGKWSCIRCLSKFEAQIKTRATMKKLGNLG